MRKLILALACFVSAPALAQDTGLLMSDWNALQVTQQHIAAELSALVQELSVTKAKLDAAEAELKKLKEPAEGKDAVPPAGK